MRAPLVTDTDIALLRTLAREHSVVAASRTVGMSRDRANYRLARLERAFGGPVVASIRGGRTFGGTRLTPLGDRIVRQGFDAVELLDSRPFSPPTRSNRLRGIYHRAPAPEVAVGRTLHLRVAFAANEGEPVSIVLDPESILLARTRFPSSARNVFRARVEQVRRSADPIGATLVVRTGSLRLQVAITRESIRLLRLAPGRSVWLYVKATALRRVGGAPARPTRGSLPN